MGTSAWDTETKRPIHVDQGVEGLPIGLAGGRYLCRACRDPLILKGARPEAKVAPHFAHQGGGPCRLPEREAQIDADDEVVIQLSHQIRALPGVTGCTLASPGDDPHQPIGLPLVVIAQCGETTVVIERPGTLPSPQAVRRRILAVRDHHAGAAHVWFLRRDPAQFGQLPSHTVRLGGRDVEHQRVAPTEQQQAILDAGGHVYWLDGKLVLVPYGYHAFRHPARPEQDWTNWPRWREDPRDDWRISKPRPAPDADCWGLVPIALSSLTRTRAVFQPADAHKIMDELYAAQEGRYRWRNRRAREVYAERHAPPPPPVTATPAEGPATAPADAPAEAQPPEQPRQTNPVVPPADSAPTPNTPMPVPLPPVAPPAIPPQPPFMPNAPRQRRWTDFLPGFRRRRAR
ncbi:competence protein CoiA [Streptomyces cellulosae]|uniref:Competence protein CoiA n=1 Tax=Streptomyces althioticus TaxID=83380 RepID=A0ABZ1YFY8_9ACTN|nr:competence protein CoiA [Streptomyces cellulosae]WTB86494.1 competence protein CoiA [Streptomyces cellulosae]WTB93320.1 competence protein CoiA [Streptomyces cellulosae]WTC60712.1 competence protein CoiA [Streptomyces cellulosae]